MNVQKTLKIIVPLFKTDLEWTACLMSDIGE